MMDRYRNEEVRRRVDVRGYTCPRMDRTLLKSFRHVDPMIGERLTKIFTSLR